MRRRRLRAEAATLETWPEHDVEAGLAVVRVRLLGDEHPAGDLASGHDRERLVVDLRAPRPGLAAAQILGGVLPEPTGERGVGEEAGEHREIIFTLRPERHPPAGDRGEHQVDCRIALRPVRAIQQMEFGGPEVLALAELPEPVPGAGEVLIEVTYAGVNFADTHQREDGYVASQSLPRIPGAEVAGVRADTGERVVALVEGGYAERVVAPADRVFAIPDGCDDGTALALLLQGLTAWHLYTTCARVEPGEHVMVISGAGGVGSLAVQLGRHFGARVTATASSEEKRAWCRELGADEAIDTGAVPDGAVDVVFELAGGEVFDACLDVLAPRGRIVVYGISSREQNTVRTGRLLKRSQSVIGFWLYHYLGERRYLEEPFAQLFSLAAEGELTARIGAVYPLAEAAQAQIDLAARRTTGKLLLRA